MFLLIFFFNISLDYVALDFYVIFIHASVLNGCSEMKCNCVTFSRRPVLVMAPLGIVTALELTFVAMFIALMIWSLGNYLYVSFGHLHMHTAGEKV